MGEVRLDPSPRRTRGGVIALTTIGSQTGLIGFTNWLENQPGVPDPGPNFDPANIATWPWDEKLRRTLATLATDHDSMMFELAQIREEMRLRPFG